MISEKGKPYILREPVQKIVEDSGGNKTIIAQQAQIGLIDPTAAVLAGMYIDRIREAEALEKEQAATVAEQVFSPNPEPEAVSQMQLAQQGLGGAPAPAPKMPAGVNMGMPPPKMPMAPKAPMAPRPPSGMAFPKPSQGIAPNLPNVNMGMAPPSNRSVAGVDKLNPNLNMAAGGGLLAFAGGGDVPGYANGSLVQNNIPSIARKQIEDRERNRQALSTPAFEDPITDQNDTGNIFAGFSNSLLSQQPGYMNFLKDYMPTESNPSDVYKQREKVIADELPKIDYDRVQQLVSPEAITKKKAELEERTGQRFTGDLAVAALLGGAEAMKGQPSTGSVLGDVIGAFGTAGTTASPQIIQAFQDKRTAEDKMFGMEEEAAFKEIGLLGAQRQEQLQIKKLAMDSGDKQLQREAAEKAAVVQGSIQAYVTQVSQKMGFNEKAAMAKVDNLTKFYEKQGYDVTDPEVQAMITDHAFSTVLVANALVKANAAERAAHNKNLKDVMKVIDAEFTADQFSITNKRNMNYYREDAAGKEKMRMTAKMERIFAEARGLGVDPTELMRRSAKPSDTTPPELDTKRIGEGLTGRGEEPSDETPSNTQNLKVGSIIEYEGVNYEILSDKKLKDLKTNKTYINQGGKLVEVN
jgi:hypothetical protein